MTAPTFIWCIRSIKTHLVWWGWIHTSGTVLYAGTENFDCSFFAIVISSFHASSNGCAHLGCSCSTGGIHGSSEGEWQSPQPIISFVPNGIMTCVYYSPWEDYRHSIFIIYFPEYLHFKYALVYKDSLNKFGKKVFLGEFYLLLYLVLNREYSFN